MLENVRNNFLVKDSYAFLAVSRYSRWIACFAYDLFRRCALTELFLGSHHNYQNQNNFNALIASGVEIGGVVPVVLLIPIFQQGANCIV